MATSTSGYNDTGAGSSENSELSDSSMSEDEASTSGTVDNDSNSLQQITRSIEEFATQQHVDQSKRFDYLLKQTELYGHFMKSAYSIAVEGDADNSSEDIQGAKRKPKQKPVVKDKVAPKQYDADIASPIVFNSSPSFIKFGTMRDYQVRGLNWLISLHANGLSGILADEMGLGKTLQSISLLGYLKNYLNLSGPHLIIAPKSTLNNWMKEIKQWCPSLKAVCLIGHKEERSEFVKKEVKGKKWNVCVTSYEMILLEKSLLAKNNWHYIIIDEAQRIKNDKSKLSEYVRKFKSSSRLLLTGTPLQNDLHELWALLNFLLPDVFSSSEDFDSWFNMNNCFGDHSLVDRLHSVLRPFLLRRIKADVEKSLLPKKEIKIYVQLTTMQREWYKKILIDDHYTVQGEEGRLPTVARLQNTIMQLKKVCNHPYLFPGAEKRPYSDATIPLHSGKLVLLEKLLPKLKEEGSRVLLFCTMTTMLDILEDFCTFKKYIYFRLDGSTEHEVRQESIDEFNSPNSEAFIFLLSTRAGGLGINLASADTVILYDSDYNPQVDLQAMDRCHRIGQKKQVRVFRLLTENTVEEKIVERAEVKLKLDRLVIQEGRLVNSNVKKETKQELLSIIKLSAEHIMKLDETAVGHEDLDTILAKSKIRSEKLTDKLEVMTETDLRNFSVEEKNPSADDGLQRTNPYLFEGKDYYQLRQKRRQNYFQIESPAEGRKRKETSRPHYEHTNSEEPENVSSQNSNSTASSSDSTNYDVQPKKMKMIHTPKPKPLCDHYFAPVGVWEFYRSELDYYRKSIRYEVPINSNLPLAEAIRIRDEEQLRLSNVERLSYMAEREKGLMMQEAYQHWTQTDFKKFVTALEKHGSNNMDLVCQELPDKSVEAVVTYSQIFWLRCDELFEFEKIMKKLHRSDLLLKKRFELQCILEAKMSRFKDHNDFQIVYSPPSCKGSQFSLIQDYNLLKALQKVRFTSENVFAALCTFITTSSDFDDFLRSRTPKELHSRCVLLMHLIQKEFDKPVPLQAERKSNIQATRKSSSKTVLPISKTDSL